ncbi:GDYXXLXY domain-containing protein [Algivirga pacifica]|uniref:GDYXXLXY protein n=1 Tax=Algivirga pacifica TaxID=1162670 RepID=A0ABP9DFU4_9BACT
MKENKKWLWIAFAIMVIVQIAVPAQMILKKEGIIFSGKVYKFRTAPVDPYDPFRGKYITLNFRDAEVPVSDPTVWERGMEVYLTLQEDAEGFAIPKDMTAYEPSVPEDYIKAEIAWFTHDSSAVRIHYPFRKYFMEESKALKAEKMYRESNAGKHQVYASVGIKEGDYVLKGVMVDGIPIEEAVEQVEDNTAKSPNF